MLSRVRNLRGQADQRGSATYKTKDRSDRLGRSALSIRDQINVTHHASVMRFAVPFALCNFFAQIRQSNVGTVELN
jgi:ribosomal protein L18